MEKEIEEIIKKNLPAQVGDVLKQRLEQAELDVVKVKQQEGTLQTKNETITALEKIIADYRKFDERNSNLDVREKSVSDKERNVEIESLKYKLEAETHKTQFAKDVALGLVRNTNYKSSIFDSENSNGYYDGNGKWHEPRNTSKSYTKEEKSE